MRRHTHAHTYPIVQRQTTAERVYTYTHTRKTYLHIYIRKHTQTHTRVDAHQAHTTEDRVYKIWGISYLCIQCILHMHMRRKRYTPVEARQIHKTVALVHTHTDIPTICIHICIKRKRQTAVDAHQVHETVARVHTYIHVCIHTYIHIYVI